MSRLSADSIDASLTGRHVALVGKLAGMGRREAQQLLRARGILVADDPDEQTEVIVFGEQDLPLGDLLDERCRAAIEAGSVEALSETQLWQRLGLVESQQNVHRLYTPAMLADLLHVPVAVIRRWHRRGLIVPARQVHRLAYFDFQEVATVRRLAELLAAGMSPQAIEKKLAELSRLLPSVERPLAQLSVIVEGKQLLLRQGDGLIDSAGQLRFDFESIEADSMVAAGGDEAVRRFPSSSRRPWRSRPSNFAIWPPASKRPAIWNWPPRRIERHWPPEARAPKLVSNWPSCCIGWATWPGPGSVIIKRSNWMKIMLKRGPI